MKELLILLKKTKPDANNEYQLTDSIKLLIEEKKPIFFKELKGKHIDIGSPERLRMANRFFSQKK